MRPQRRRATNTKRTSYSLRKKGKEMAQSLFFFFFGIVTVHFSSSWRSRVPGLCSSLARPKLQVKRSDSGH